MTFLSIICTYWLPPLQKARQAIQSAKVSPKLSQLLTRIMEYPNIPRKKKKFEVRYDGLNCFYTNWE